MERYLQNLLIIILLLSSVTMVAAQHKVYTPILTVRSVPPSTLSRYMYTVDPVKLHGMGRKAALENQTGVIILFYGAYFYNSSTGQYGTRLFDGSFISITQIEEAVKGWIKGYWANSIAGMRVELALSVNNSGTVPSYYGHGVNWGGLINRLDSYVSANNYSSRIGMWGANDIEPAFDLAIPSEARSWVEGYSSVARRPYFNTGSCDGCPTDADPNEMSNGWKIDDVFYVSWEIALAYPLPQIYAENHVQSEQWYFLDKWGQSERNLNITYPGMLTQYQACIDQNHPPECTNLENTPVEGWNEFMNKLRSDPRTTQGNMQWLTDVSWMRDF